MFKADILNMKGGREPDVDVRMALCHCAEEMSQCPETINLCVSQNLVKYDNRRIPLILPVDQHGNLPTALDQETVAGLKPFSTHKLMDDGNKLVEQLGHQTVKDAAGEGTYNKSNLLYSGTNVVEYDLVENDSKGKYYVYSEPSVLEEIVVAKSEGRYKTQDSPLKTGDEFLDSILESSCETINNLIDNEGHYVSSGKLLTDIMVMMRLYDEKTRQAENACVDPAFRQVLAACHDWCESKPLFNVAFIVNAALMGLKVVFYPTALEWDSNEVDPKDCSKLKRLLKIQLALLGHCMTKIVREVEEIKKKYVFCFEIDVRGSSNWNLPGHCKDDHLAFPYHHARLRGPNRNVLEVTNRKMVTSLGVIDCHSAREWMYGYLGQFERRTAYAEKIMGVLATTGDAADWKRKVLFSDIGPELPFRNKSIIMDIDFCLSGMCYSYLASGQGILLTKRTDEEDTDSRIFAGVAEDRKDAEASTEQGGEDEEGIEEKTRKARPAPPVPTNIQVNATTSYDELTEQVAALLVHCDEYGMFLADKNTAPGLAMKIISANKNTTKKGCMDSLSDTAVLLMKIVSKNQKLRHEIVLPFAILQLVMRYECRNMVLPRDSIILCSRMRLRKWSSINFSEVWKFAHGESIKPPSADISTNLPVVSDGETPSTSSEQQCNRTGSIEEEIVQKDKDGGGKKNMIINDMLSTTASTFASGADKKDTMFAWVMVTLAERFCALYNIASNPEEYYNQQHGKMYFDGGLAGFKKMCAAMLPELEVYIPKSSNATLKVCRMAVKGYEAAVERNKNMTNSKVCKLKLAELKVIHGLNDEFSGCVNLTELPHVTNMVECRNDKVRSTLFDPIQEEAERWEIEKNNNEGDEVAMSSGEDECEESETYFVPPNFEDDVIQKELAADEETGEGERLTSTPRSEPVVKESMIIEKFFRCVNDNRSFKFRSSLCHRQKYVSVSVVKYLEDVLCQLLTLKRTNKVGDTLKEIRERSKRMREWVVPFTLPTNSIDKFKNVGDSFVTARRCNCFQIYSGSPVNGLDSCDRCIKLLVLPSSVHLKSLTVALKFNTMACERRYFSDVSTALGFVPTPVSSSQIIDTEDSRWKSIARFKCAGDFLEKVHEGGVYDNVILGDRELVDVFKPRTAARKNQAKYNCKTNHSESNKHTGFFSGVWALCADHDLETTVLGSTVISPLSPTPIFNVTDHERSTSHKKIERAREARSYFKYGTVRCPLSFFECFEEMTECMRRTNVSTSGNDPRGDAKFFSGLTGKYGKAHLPGGMMWTLFHTVSECFKNSLPFDWSKLTPDWSKRVLNLTEGVSNVDESGAVFEVAKFLSVCARSFFGDCLNNALSADTWEKLLNESCWVGKLARAYGSALEDNDVRVVESFIDSSAFLSNNNITEALKISQTENESVRYAVWNDSECLEEGETGMRPSPLRKRAEWLSITESGLAEHMSFSFVLACVSLFRVTLDCENAKKLAEPNQTKVGGVCQDAGRLVPLIRGLKITSSWCKTFAGNVSDDNAMKCLNEMRFPCIERDPLYFYRFAGYAIGLIAANDVILESISRRILDSFDFNGFDTSSWTQFIRHHFTSVLLGRRARLLSRPLAFVKGLVGLSTNRKNFMKGCTDFEKRVGTVTSRLAKLILVKAVESESITINNILDCCVLSDDDVTVRSLHDLYNTVRSEFDQDKLDCSFSLASNACSNEQLAKVKTSARLLNCNVSFHDISSYSNVIDVEEEALIDPSVDAAEPTTADSDDSKHGGKFKRGEDNVDAHQQHSHKAMSKHNNNCNPTGTSSRVFSYDDTTMDEDGDPSDFEVTARSTKLLSKLKTMLLERDINISVVQIINKLRKFLTVYSAFNCSEWERYGVKREVIEAGIEAVSRWNTAVENECLNVIKECQQLQTVGSEYDMSVVTPEDYAKSKNRSCAYAADAMLCKTAPTTFINILPRQDDTESDFSWLNFNDKKEKLSKHDVYNCGGGRLKGYAAKDCIRLKNGAIAEVRVLAEEFSYGVKDSYWSAVLPLKGTDTGTNNNVNGKRNWPKDWRGGHSRATFNATRERPASNLKMNNKTKDVKVTGHCDNLLSLYNADSAGVNEPGSEEDDFKTTINTSDVFVLLGGTSDTRSKYKCLFPLWYCNNGISPKNQVELLKKLVYKNTNVLWIKQYDRHINVLNNWGCLNASNVNDLHFSLRHGNIHAEVTDNVPPLSVFHSRFLCESDCEFLLTAVEPLVWLRKRMQAENEGAVGEVNGESDTSEDHYHRNMIDSRLMSAVYSREILSSCLDPKGKFCTSCISNSCSVLFTPGTSKEAKFEDVSCWDERDPIYVDEDLVGREEETSSRNYVSVALEVTTALSNGVFFQGERISKDKPAGLKGGRVLRPVNYNELFVVDQQSSSNNIGSTALDNMKGAIGIFETTTSNNVISETNDCVLLNCQKARCLMMSQRAVLNNTSHKRYDGEVFELSSMRYHAGVSKGYLLDDESDLYSVYGRTRSQRIWRPETEIRVFSHCAEHFLRPNTDKFGRVFVTDWGLIKCLMEFGSNVRNSLDRAARATLTPYEMSVIVESNQNPPTMVRPLKNISQYNRKPIQLGKSDDLLTASFLANPCGPARRLLQRAPNMRLCVTNAGTALLSRKMAQTTKLKGFEEMVLDGSITSFRLMANNSCISVDGNRVFLIDGTYLLGGRVENINIATDMFTRCKLRSEKHVVFSSLFSSKLVSACLATAIEGTTLGQGLGLVEHVTSMKNTDVSNVNHRCFWSSFNAKISNITDSNKGKPLTYKLAMTSDGMLRPPSVYIDDESYVFLRMLYEISRAADCYSVDSVGTGDLMTTDKMLSNVNSKTTSVDTTKAALYATRKCYTACVDQKTGIPRLHVVYFLRGLMNFGGFCTAISSGDGEKSHHLIHTLNSVALNLATKTLVMLVGTTGNNLKTTLIDVLKKSWFERFADVNVGVLNTARDSSSSTQTNIAPFAGKKNILVVDEVGYQGSTVTHTQVNNSNRSETQNLNNGKEKLLYGDVNEIKASHGIPTSSTAHDASAVWEQINSAMIESKLKICSKECNDIMAARSKDVTADCHGTLPLPTEGDQHPSTSSTNERKGNLGKTDTEVEVITNSRWLLRVANSDGEAAALPPPLVLQVKSFATNAIWWNCMSGTMSHKFSDAKTTFSMMNGGRYPFSVSNFHDSPWLKETDAIAQLCAKPPDRRGKYTVDEVNEAVHCLFGDYASSHLHLSPSECGPLLLQDCAVNRSFTKKSATMEEVDEWKEREKGSKHRSGFERAEQIFSELVTGDSLLRWTVMNSVVYGDRRPVLSCLLTNKDFLNVIKEKISHDILRANASTVGRRLDVEEYGFKESNAATGGVLYAFHCIHSGCRGYVASKYKRAVKVRKAEGNQRDIFEVGPVLGGIAQHAIARINSTSRKLSSIIFGGKTQHDVDEDSYVNMEREYDMALLNLMEKPWSACFPKITTDGSSTLSTSKEDCKRVLTHIKKAIIDTGGITTTGSFVRLCSEDNLLDNLDGREQAPLPPTSSITAHSVFGDICSMFSPHLATPNDKLSSNTAVAPLKAKSKKLMTSLVKYKSDGRTMAVSEVARAVSSRSDTNSAVTRYMLPGQFNSNALKKMTSKGSSIYLRSVYSKPVMSSFTMTPIMTSNSYVFTFFVDEALFKRMITFPCETQFAFKSKNEEVQNFVDLVDSGLWCVHSVLALERHARWTRAGSDQAPEDIKSVNAMANKSASVWNGSVQQGMNTEEYISDLSSVAALLPARALQHLVKYRVLEHRDAPTMSRLEECCNTFMHMYTTFTLASKSKTVAGQMTCNGGNSTSRGEPGDGNNRDTDIDDTEGGKSEEELSVIEMPAVSLKRKRPCSINRPAISVKKQSTKTFRPLQMCHVNPKSLNTMAMAITRSRQGAWAKINTAMNCVMLVDTPFVHTSRLFGEGCNLKMFVPSREGVHPAINLDWCIGLRMPNPDMDVRGYDREGAMIGAGAAIMKQVCDAWGSTDIKQIMFSCHHLHMLFELVLQFSHPKTKLNGICTITKNNKAGMDYVAVIFACMIYKEMMSKLRYPVFLKDKNSMSTKKQTKEVATDDTLEGNGFSPLEIPMFVSMVINKPLAALRFTTNLSDLTTASARDHSEMIKYVTSQLGQNLNPGYLCPSCRKRLHVGNKNQC